MDRREFLEALAIAAAAGLPIASRARSQSVDEVLRQSRASAT